MARQPKEIKIGKISNEYGDLRLRKTEDGSYEWSITCFLSEKWEKIPFDLAKQLLKLRDREETAQS